jgi:hypothetical protein
MSVRPKTRTTTAALAAVVAAVAVLSAALVASIGTTAAAPPTADPPLAADYGAGWLEDQIQADGSLPGGFDPLGDAGNAALSLGAAGVGGAAFDRAVGHVEANIDDFVAYPFDPTIDDPGRLGKAIMLAELTGADPSSFGGTDLVGRLEATLGLLEPGLYGANDPTFDGVFRQGLAVTALLSAGEPVPNAARQWLIDQQCDAPAASLGAWEDYRADPAAACAPPDPVTFTGPDSNSTAMAIMALEASAGVYLDPTGYLEATQEPDGGWGFIAGAGSDPSSTSLVIRALIAMGEDPIAWSDSGGDPWSSLLSWQQGCDAVAADRGAFTSSFAEPPGTPDVLSTIDGIAGAAGQPYPLTGSVSLTPGAPDVDCSPVTTTTTGPTSSTAGPVRPAGLTGTAEPATAVTATPAFTG